MVHSTLQTPAAAALLLTLGIASATDLLGRVIPNWLVAGAGLIGLALAVAGGWVGAALIAGVLAASPFFVAALIRPEGMGMGDVKLAGVLGIYLGQTVWIALAIGLALAALTGVLVSLGKRLPPSQTALPLAPFLALGAGAFLVLAGGLVPGSVPVTA